LPQSTIFESIKIINLHFHSIYISPPLGLEPQWLFIYLGLYR
jgi:hypothetical protein